MATFILIILLGICEHIPSQSNVQPIHEMDCERLLSDGTLAG
jgi:hypothetical protein